MSPPVCLFFRLHQPRILRADYSFFRIGRDHGYEDRDAGRKTLLALDAHCVRPALRVLERLVRRHRGRFRVALQFSGSTLDLLAAHAPGTVARVRDLAAGGCLELVGGPAAPLVCPAAFPEEADLLAREQAALLERLFGFAPDSWHAPGAPCDAGLARRAAAAGHRRILAEAWPGEGAPSVGVIEPGEGLPTLMVLSRHERLSCDLDSRFGDPLWPGSPLSAATFASWARGAGPAPLHLFLDLRAFDRRRAGAAGFGDFLADFAGLLLRDGAAFLLPREVEPPEAAPLVVPEPPPAASVEGQLRAAVRDHALSLEEAVRKNGNDRLVRDWRLLLDGGHWNAADGGDTTSPHRTFVLLCNMLNDIGRRAGRGALTSAPWRGRGCRCPGIRAC